MTLDRADLAVGRDDLQGVREPGAGRVVRRPRFPVQPPLVARRPVPRRDPHPLRALRLARLDQHGAAGSELANRAVLRVEAHPATHPRAEPSAVSEPLLQRKAARAAVAVALVEGAVAAVRLVDADGAGGVGAAPGGRRRMGAATGFGAFAPTCSGAATETARTVAARTEKPIAAATRPRPDAAVGIQDHEQSPFELAAVDHRQRGREAPRLDAQRLGDLHQVAGVGGGTRAEAKHGLVARLLADEAGVSLGQPRQRVEPVDRRDQAPREQPPRVSPRKVHELVLDDDAPSLVGPAFGRGRQQHGGARPAAGERRLDGVGREQRHRPGQTDGAARLHGGVEPGPRKRTRRGPKLLLAAQRARQSQQCRRPAQQPHGEQDRARRKRDLRLSRSRDQRVTGGVWHEAGCLRRLALWTRERLGRNRRNTRRDDRPRRRPDPARHERERPARQERRKRRRQEQPDRGQRQDQVARPRGLATQQTLEAERHHQHERGAEREAEEPGRGVHLSAPSHRRLRSAP